jgi:predicted RNase H-like nuclease (RuvC/YqgF family)
LAHKAETNAETTTPDDASHSALSSSLVRDLQARVQSQLEEISKLHLEVENRDKIIQELSARLASTGAGASTALASASSADVKPDGSLF